MNNSINMLEFNVIIDKLVYLAQSNQAKTKLKCIKPVMNQRECIRLQQDTTNARLILDTYGTPPVSAMNDMEEIIALTESGGMLAISQLETLSHFVTACKRMKSFLKKIEQSENPLAYQGRAFVDLSDLKEEIDRSIKGEGIADEASPNLKNVRRKIEQAECRVREKMESLMRSKGKFFTDSYISIKNGRYVLPVKKEYKSQIPGSVIHVSATGSTCFIEPASVARFREELEYLKIDEENEIHKILYILTALAEEKIQEIKLNMDSMEVLDIAFAKGKLSSDLNGTEPVISGGKELKIINGRHPLLDQKKCVPLNIHMEKGIGGIVITGPNTGGKTVALKTVGLLSAMAQSGLHIPAEAGCVLPMYDQVLCDIGDGQSISENLSTFSSHITNITSILKQITHESLVLLDELGSGTDPAEGMGIAVAILEELHNKNCMFVATTHYPEVKEYAEITSGIINARMAFDKENLAPLYKLEIGEAGESCALYIAQKLQFPEHLIEIARKTAYPDYKNGHKKQTQNFEWAFDENRKTHSEKINSTKSIIKREADKVSNKNNKMNSNFQIGDSVIVHPDKKRGIVFQPENKQGEVGVQIKGVKQMITYKRIKLDIPATELYPPDYDFSIIFDSVENRKIRHKMDRKYIPGLEIKHDNEI